MKFGALLIDCPWSFRVWSKATGHGRSAESHYPTMEIDELKALPVPELMERDCAVFMWTTWPRLAWAMSLGEAYGLEYKTCAFLWAKANKSTRDRLVVLSDDANWFMGMGYYSRSNSEPCLLFTQGYPKRMARNVRQLVVAPVREHSRKPDEVRWRIERLVSGPYLELFARKRSAGWWSLGNELDGRDIREAIAELAARPSISCIEEVLSLQGEDDESK